MNDKMPPDQTEPDTSKAADSDSLPARLLGPTLDMLGERIRDGVEAYLDQRKEEKRRKNIEGFVAKSKNRIDGRGPDDVRSMDSFLDWIEGAQDVDPDGGPLGDLWNEMLVRIALHDTADTAMLIETLKKLGPGHAEVLILAGTKRSPHLDDRQRYYANQLIEWKVLTSNPMIDRTAIATGWLMCSVLGLIGLVTGLFANSTLMSAGGSVLLGVVIVPLLASRMFGLGLSRKIVRWADKRHIDPTWMGDALLAALPRHGSKTADESSNPPSEE